MANKKFYYRNKNRKPHNTPSEAAADTLYTADQLALSFQDLGISENTCELLLKNKLSTAADLVMRTEKDMYKVQGFNKKMLFDVKDALRRQGMALREDVVKPKQSEKKNEQSSKQKNNESNKDANSINTAKQEKQERSSKFGLADRRNENKNKQHQASQTKQTPHSHQSERLTEPLPIGSWRKIMKGGKWGFSDGFRTIIPAMYDEVFCFKEGLASVEIDGKCGYIDGENNIVVPFDYDIAMSFSDGLAMVAKGDKCGYINRNNEVIIPFEYDAATPFEDGEAKVKKDGKWATVTKENKLTWI